MLAAAFDTVGLPHHGIGHQSAISVSAVSDLPKSSHDHHSNHVMQDEALGQHNGECHQSLCCVLDVKQDDVATSEFAPRLSVALNSFPSTCSSLVLTALEPPPRSL